MPKTKLFVDNTYWANACLHNSDLASAFPKAEKLYAAVNSRSRGETAFPILSQNPSFEYQKQFGCILYDERNMK